MDYKTSLNASERELLRHSRVAVVGCGGTGCYAVEHLIRLGVGHIKVIDGDVFNASNLNRQLYCTRKTLGGKKVHEAALRASDISDEVEVIEVDAYLTPANAQELICGSELVIDALDSLEARRTLQEACKKLGIPLIFGAIGPWRVQVGIIPPDSTFLYDTLIDPTPDGERVLSFVPATCAAIEVSEAVKLLCGEDAPLDGRLVDIDLLSGETIQIKL